MSLAELFYAKHPRRPFMSRFNRRSAKTDRSVALPLTPHPSRFSLEALEPRVLLSATPTEVFANQVLEPAAITVPAGSLPSLDVDLNGQADALSDGIVIIRHLFGFTGDALTNGVIDPTGRRTDPTEIGNYLTSITSALDVELDGQSDALTDGIVILRSLFGFTGQALIDGATSPFGQRPDPAAIATYLDNMNPQRELIAPLLMAGLQEDTGFSSTDAITFDPTITGTIADINQITALTAGFDATPVANFVDILTDLQPDGIFALSTVRLNTIFGSPLPDGVHTLHLRATDARGNLTTLDQTLTLDRTVPITPTFDLASASDTAPIGDFETLFSTVALTGQTEANSIVTLLQGNVVVSSNQSGAFSFNNVPLAFGSNALTIRVTDQAGNISDVTTTFTRLQSTNQPPVLTPIGPLTVFPGGHLEVPFSASDPNGDRVQFFVTSAAPLPTSMLNGSGTFIITPAPGEEGIYSFNVIASDGPLTSSQTVSLTVAHDPTATTRISGRVVGTTGEPLAGVPIEVGRIITLTAADGTFTLDLPAILIPTESFNITIPTGDIFFDPFNTGTQFISMRRAGSDPATGTNTSNPLQHPNLVTSFLDGNIVYGSDPDRAQALRTLQGGTLKTSAGNLLPFNTTTFFPNGPLENDNGGNANPGSLFVAGDVRASENVALEAMHTILLREHNRLADEIAAANPTFTDEQIFQQARRWLIGELQHIVYSEYLPVLLGADALPTYTGYNTTIDPATSAVFATAAFRLGHSQMVSQLLRLDATGAPLASGPLNLRDAFFTTAPITTDGIDPIMRGLLAQQAQEIDSHVVDELRNFLFGPPGSGGMDLVSLNIQRGRDMGLPSYTQARLDFGLSPITSFSQITSDVAAQQMLQSVYGTVDKVDVWVGGIAEDHVAGALIGPLFQKIIAEQFTRTRDADRFWYENSQFTATELTQIRSTTFADIIARNTGLTNLPTNVFTANVPPTGPAPAGTAATTTPIDFRSPDGSGNHQTEPTLGQTGTNLLANFTQSYGDGVSTPGGSDRPGAREISNAVFPQTGSIQNTQGATALAVFFGQILSHDLSLTATGITDTIKIHGDQAAPAGTYPFVAEKLPLMLGHDVYAGLNNIIARPIFLPAIDLANAVQVSATQDTIVDTAAIPGAVVNIAAGTLQDRSGNPFTGLLSITQVPTTLTPASLPPNLNPDLVVTIQPADMVLTTPAPIALPNSGGYMPGDILDLWSINPLTGQFDLIGKGQVSEDGTVIETIEGGIRNSSWHFFTAPAQQSVKPSTEENGCGCTCPGNPVGGIKATAPGFSEVELYSGALLESHALVSYQSQGIVRGLTLAYDSLRADPRPVVTIGVDNARPGPDEYLTAKLMVENGSSDFLVPGGTMPGQTGDNWNFWRVPDFPVPPGFNVAFGSIEAALQTDLSQLPTGLYAYQATYGVQRYRPPEVLGVAALPERFVGSTSTFTGTVISVNSIQSPFGAGWGLAGLQQVVRNFDGSLLLVDGGGRQLLFKPSSNVGEYVSPPGDFSVLRQLAGGSGYERVMTDQSVYIFNAAGLLTSVRDRLGNQSTFEYDGTGKLLKVVDPVGLMTIFTYTGDRATKITDPAGRMTLLEYDTAGNLTRITDPDGTFRTWSYDSQHHMVGEVDQRGNTKQEIYDYAGRVTGAIRKDGTAIQVMPVETSRLSRPELTSNWQSAPVAKKEGPSESLFVAPNGNVIRTILDQAGQTVLSLDSLGQLPNVERNAQNLVVRFTDANGNSTFYTYDDNGNLLSRKDSLSGGNRVTATIAQAGEQDLYAFTLKEDTQLYFDSFTNSSNFTWSLTGPAGALVTNRSFSGSDGSSIFNSPVLRAVAGDYTLTVDAISNTTGTYDFRLSDLKNAESLAFNTPVAASLEPGNETDLYKFEAVAGDKVFFDRQGAPGFVNASWRLLDPFGSQVFGSTSLNDVDTLTLDKSGTYTLLLEGAVTNTTPLAYTFTVYDASGDITALTFNATTAGAIDVPGEQDRYTFSIDSDAVLFMDTLTANTSLSWGLSGPSGVLTASHSFLGEEPLLFLTPGTYSMTIDATGETVASYVFRLVELSAATPMALGTPVTGTLGGNTANLYRFTVPEGQRVFFDRQALSAQFAPPGWALIDPFGRELFDQPFVDVDVQTLAVAGTYTLFVGAGLSNQPTYTPTYSFTIYDATPPTAGLILNGQADGAIDVPGQADVYTFTLGVPTQLYFDSLTSNSSLSWSLAGPRGVEVSNQLFTLADSGSAVLTVPEGSYTLTVNESGDLTGPYSFRLWDLAGAPALTPGTAVSGTLNPAKETDLYRFTAQAGERFYFDVQALSGTTPVWRLIDSYGNVVFGPSSMNIDVDVTTLTSGGTYTLLVEGAITATTSAIYTLNVQKIIDDQPALVLNTTTSGTIDHVGQRDLYSFTLAQASLLYFDALTNDNRLAWTLTGPRGIEVSARLFTASDSFNLNGTPLLDLPSGDYVLTIDAAGDFTGAYDFRLVDLAAVATVSQGVVINGGLTPPNETDLYRFSAAAGDQLFFDVQAASDPGNSAVSLFGPLGTVVISRTSLSDRPTVALPIAGFYTLLIEGRITNAGTDTYTFSLTSQGNIPPPLPTGTGLTLDGTTTGDIAISGETDTYLFTLGSTTRLYFDSLTNQSSLTWSLSGPRGAEVSNRAFTQSDGLFTSGVAVPAGSYTLTVDATGDVTGPYSFRLWDLAGAPALTPGTAVDGTLSPANETDLYRFTASAGERFFFDVQALAVTTPVWRLIDPYGNVVFGPTFMNVDVDVTTLGATGNYALLVEGAIGATTSATYTLNVQKVTDDQPALVLNTTTSGAIDHAGQRDLYSVTLGSTTRLYFDSRTNQSSLTWSLTGPRGAEVSNRAFTQSDGLFTNGLTVPAGSYTLTVDATGDVTGPYSFRLWDLAEAPALTPGTAVDGTLSPATETDLYRFTASAGERFFFDVQALAGPTPVWRLIDPYGNVVFGPTFMNVDVDVTTLGATGNYALLVEGAIGATTSATYTLNVQKVTDDQPALVLNTTTSGAIDHAGQRDLYSVTLGSTTRLYFDSRTNQSSLTWSLTGPRGAEVSNRAFTQSDGLFTNGLTVPAGSYTLTVDATGDVTGPYSFRLWDLAEAPALTPGTAVDGTLSPATETDLYRFTASAGERFFFDVQALAGPTPVWRLIDPYGNVVFGPTFMNVDVDVTTLGVTGSYALLVEGAISATTAATYRLNVQKITDDQPALVLNTTTSGAIDHAGQRDLYTFTLGSTTRLYFDSLTNQSSLTWSLTGPRGAEVSNRAFTQSDGLFTNGLTVPAGSYTLTVDATGDVTGPYSFRLWDLAEAPALTPGTAVDGTLSPANETDLYRFTASAGERFFFDVQALAGPTPVWRLIDPYGNVVFGPTFMNVDVDVTTLGATGNYALLVEGAIGATTSATYQLNVQKVMNSTQPLSLNLRTNGTVTTAGEQDTYTFLGTVGQRLYYDGLDLDPSKVNVRLLAPSGAAVWTTTFGTNPNVAPFTLRETGTYQLVFDGVGDQVGAYAFRMSDLTSARLITMGTAKSGQLNPLSETDLYAFDGVGGASVLLDRLANSSLSANWRLFGLTNQILANGNIGTDLSAVLPATGRYVISIEGTGAAAGTPLDYQFQVTTPVDTPVAVSGLGSVLSGTIAAGQVVTTTFTAPQGRLIYVESQDRDLDQVTVELRDPGNAVVYFGSASQLGGPLVLSRSGQYTINIKGTTTSSTGDYRLRIVDIATEAVALTLNTPVTVSMPFGSGAVFYRITGTAGQRLLYDGLDNTDSDSLTAKLLAPSGATLFTHTDGLNPGPFIVPEAPPFILPETGTYYLLLEARQTVAADSIFTLRDLATATPVVLGLATNGALTGFETDLYQFFGAPGQHAFFDGLSSHGSSDGSWTLYGPQNQKLGGSTFGLVQNDFEVLLPQLGTYTLVVSGNFAGTTATPYSFLVAGTTDLMNTSFTPVGDSRATGNGVVVTYDPIFSQVTSLTDELGKVTLFDIDPLNGNTRSITRVVGTPGDDDDVMAQFTYTTQGLIDLVTDPLGRITDYDYDLLGRLTKVTLAKGTVDQGIQQFEYDLAGNLTALIDENSHRTEFEYDAMDRLTLIRDALGFDTQFAYDLEGNLIRTTDAKTNQTLYAYDVFDRLTSMTDANSGLSAYAYDVNHNLLSATDPLGHRTSYVYDLRNRLTSTVDPAGGVTRFTYDLNNNLTSLIDSVGNGTLWAYDARNRVSVEIDPLGKPTRYQYDAVNNLIGMVDRNGQATTYAYDDLDRLIAETWVGGGNVVTSTYDKASNLTSILDQFSSLTFTYDNRDRVSTVDNNGTPGAPHVALEYAYDGAGNILAVNDTINGAAAGTNAYTYDARNSMTRVTQSGNGVSSKRVDFTYNEIGQFDSIMRYSDLAAGQTVAVTNYVYDALNRLTNMAHKNAANTVLDQFQIEYDPASRITKITDIDGPTDYAYDTRNQLTGASHADAANQDEVYQYDANGNRISSSLHGTGYVTGPGNRLASDGTYDYVYDGKGSLIRRTEIATGKVREFDWDQRGRLVEIDDLTGAGQAATQIVEFTYDAFNRRISKTVDADGAGPGGETTTHFAYDRDDVLLDFVGADGSGTSASPTLAQRYLQGPAVDQILAQEDGAGNVFWMLTDHLGTVRDLVNNSGVVANHLTYDSYGNVISETNSLVDTRYGFTGREFDTETSLYYYRARYYDTALGRFIASDSIGLAGGSNTYAYVAGNPIAFRDPLGLIRIKVIKTVDYNSEGKVEPKYLFSFSFRTTTPVEKVLNQVVDKVCKPLGILRKVDDALTTELSTKDTDDDLEGLFKKSVNPIPLGVSEPDALRFLDEAKQKGLLPKEVTSGASILKQLKDNSIKSPIPIIANPNLLQR